MAFVAAILFLCTANMNIADKRGDYGDQPPTEDKKHKNKKHRNPAYDNVNENPTYTYPAYYADQYSNYDPYATKTPMQYPEFPTVDYGGYRY